MVIKQFFFQDINFFFWNFDLVTYTHYSKKLLNHFLLDFKFRENISIIKEKIFIKKIKKINKKIDLIKIDTNGFELSVIQGIIHIIKKDRPALIIELNQDEKKIEQLLKKFSYKAYYYSINKKKLTFKKKKYSTNKYYLQKNHLI
tara:strand:- start:434 stop:868 length:435 start_codon:yes stop_codon:yes gene_type:complete